MEYCSNLNIEKILLQKYSSYFSRCMFDMLNCRSSGRLSCPQLLCFLPYKSYSFLDCYDYQPIWDHILVGNKRTSDNFFLLYPCFHHIPKSWLVHPHLLSAPVLWQDKSLFYGYSYPFFLDIVSLL